MILKFTDYNKAIVFIKSLIFHHNGDCYCYSQGEDTEEDASHCNCYNSRARTILRLLNEPFDDYEWKKMK